MRFSFMQRAQNRWKKKKKTHVKISAAAYECNKKDENMEKRSQR